MNQPHDLPEQEYDWYNSKVGQAHEKLHDVVSAIDSATSSLNSLRLIYMALYDPSLTAGLEGSFMVSDLRTRLPSARPSWNVIQSVIDTVVSYVASDLPRIRFATSDGPYEERQLAIKQSDCIDGLFWATGFKAEARDAFRDACWSGDGFVKWFIDHANISCERVFPSEIYVDPLDGLWGRPRSIHHVKTVSKQSLRDKLGRKYLEAIDNSTLVDEHNPCRQTILEPTSFCESFHLPGPDGKGGRHVIWMSSATVKDDTWEYDCFPISRVGWLPRPRGYNMRGLPEMLRSTQREVNRLLQKIHNHLRLASTKVFLQKGSRVNKRALNNREMGVIEYAGQQKPTIETIAAIAPEYYQHLERLYMRAFEIAGVSMMHAQVRKPDGLNSGKSLIEFDEMQTKRFKEVERRLHDFVVENGLIAWMMANKLKKGSSKSVHVMARPERGGRIYKVEFPADEFKPDEYRARAYATNSLADHPAGRYQLMEMMVQLDPNMQKHAVQLWDNPDLRAFTDRENSDQRLIEKIAHMILTGDEDVPDPEPTMDLQLAADQMRRILNEAIADGEPQPKIDRIRTWLTQVNDLLNAARQQAQMEQMQMMQAAAMQGQQPGGGKPGDPGGMAAMSAPPEGMPPQAPPEGMLGSR